MRTRGKAFREYGQVVLLIAAAVTSAVWSIRVLGVLKSLEFDAFDQMVQHQPAIGLDDRILVVGIGEADIDAQDNWPMPDNVMADLLAQLQRHNPKVIGLDLYRNIAHPPGQENLRLQLEADNIIVIEKLGGSNAVPAPDSVPAERVGFNNFVQDDDQVLRRNLIAVDFGNNQYRYSFSLLLSMAYLNDLNLPLTFHEKGMALGLTLFPDLDKTSGSYTDPDIKGFQILARYRSNLRPSRQVTLNQILNDEVDPMWIKDKIVIIGTVAPSIKDVFLTPHITNRAERTSMPGVLVHAHLTGQILRAVLEQEQLFWFFPDWLEALWMLGWAIWGGTIAWIIRHPAWISVGLAVSVLGLVSGSYLLFLNAAWVPVWPAVLTLGSTGGLVFSYKALYKLLYDTLTGLPQKTLFLKIVERALRTSYRQKQATYIAIFFVDLDGFKRINESLGHEQGDYLLLVLTARFKDVLPSNSHISRFVGDKFAIRVSNLAHDAAAVSIARTLQTAIQKPLKLDEQEIVTSASIGIALQPCDTEISAGELLRDAQTATHQAKARGKNHIEVFTSNMRLNIIAHFQTEADLRHAIERQELLTYYQPFISLKTGKIAGFEALIRWQHPEHGLVPPGKFIPVAEDTDLIIPIGQWILQEACQQMQRWHAQFKLKSPPIISVNLSGRQFTQPNLVHHIEQTLKRTGLPGEYLKLELTESILMDDVSSVIDTLNQMKRLNLKISIDDFGTGYSSLSYLHRFPIDTLKVDRSFVMNIDDLGEDHAIVETIITLGHHLGMDVIAEGIETAEQAQKLTTLSCEYGQGYYFARPLPAEDAEALLYHEAKWLDSA
ncbi:MAG: EAL domain-containing protein [Cyanobacteria bacterium P01_F01_bin.150]